VTQARSDGQNELAEMGVGAHAAVALAHFLGRARAEGDANAVDALQRVLIMDQVAGYIRNGACDSAEPRALRDRWVAVEVDGGNAGWPGA